MTQLRRRSFVFYSAAVTTGACNRRQRAGQDVRIVVAGTPSSLSYLPHAVAQRLNLYGKQDLKVTVDVVPGGTKGAQALLGGSADVVVGYFDHSVRLAAQGQMLRSFVTMTRYPGNALVLSSDNSRTKHAVEELKHAVVGVFYREALLHSMNMFSVNGVMPLEGPAIVQKVLSASLDNVRGAHLDLTKTYTNEFVTGN